MQGCASWSANTSEHCSTPPLQQQMPVGSTKPTWRWRQQTRSWPTSQQGTQCCNWPLQWAMLLLGLYLCCWQLRRDTYAWYTARRSPARVGLTACTVNAIVLHKQRSRKSTKPAMRVWRLSLALTIWPNTNKKEDTRRNRQYGRICLLTLGLRYSHIQMLDSILICRLIIYKSICTRHNVAVFCLDCMMRCACMQHFIPYCDFVIVLRFGWLNGAFH